MHPRPVPNEGHLVTDFATLFNFQSKSRRNARRAVHSLGVHREEREEADRAVRAAADAPTSPASTVPKPFHAELGRTWNRPR